MTLHADGDADGIIAGYHAIDSLWDSMTRDGNGGTQFFSGFSCPALYEAMHKLADGYKDPKTGQCTAISAAYRVKAVRAFVIPPKTGPV